MRKTKKWLAMGLSLSLVVSAMTGLGKTTHTSKAATDYGLSNPRTIQASEVPKPGTGGQPELKNPRTSETGHSTWDCIYFGNYWQEDTNGDGKADKNDEKTPIKWRVLSVDGDDVFLLADKNLDVQMYNDTGADVTWETCTMRSWLNGYGADANVCQKDYADNNFLDNAFSEKEQSAIMTTDVVNDDNPDYGTEGGNNTQDKVYLLSIDEVRNSSYGFSEEEEILDQHKRISVNTEYVADGGETHNDYMGSAASQDDWWLRSPGSSSNCASNVSYGGYVDSNGITVDCDNRAARPALHLNLSSASGWSYAGSVCSDERVGTWDCVYFGNYWQENTNGDGKADKNDEKTPIKWRVLSVDGDDVFLLADKNLDVQRYNDTDTDVTWETCTMRSWLNGYGADANVCQKDYADNNFLDNAFSEREQSAIMTTDVVNDDNPEYGTEGGKNTQDKVYLLSIEESTNPDYGFPAFTDATFTRRAVNTAYVADGGECMSSADGYLWLRSPGFISYFASYVHIDGIVAPLGSIVHDHHFAARPALHLNLSSTSDWSYAGTVSSDGSMVEIAPPELEKPEETENPQVTISPTPTTTVKPSETPETSVAPTVTPIATSIPTPEITASPMPEETKEPQVTTSPMPTTTLKPSVTPSENPMVSAKPSTAPIVTSIPTASPEIKPTIPPVVQPSPAPVGGTPVVNPPILTPAAPSLSPAEKVKAPSAVKATKVKTTKKNTATVTWKKEAKVAGYQIQYSLNKKFKPKSTKWSKSAKITLKKLKKGKTYYVRIRAYRLDGTKKVYGKWSSVKKVKVK